MAHAVHIQTFRERHDEIVVDLDPPGCYCISKGGLAKELGILSFLKCNGNNFSRAYGVTPNEHCNFRIVNFRNAGKLGHQFLIIIQIAVVYLKQFFDTTFTIHKTSDLALADERSNSGKHWEAVAAMAEAKVDDPLLNFIFFKRIHRASDN